MDLCLRSKEEWKEELKMFFLLILSCCSLVSRSSSIVGVVVEKTFSPHFEKSVFSIVLALAFVSFHQRSLAVS